MLRYTSDKSSQAGASKDAEDDGNSSRADAGGSGGDNDDDSSDDAGEEDDEDSSSIEEPPLLDIVIEKMDWMEMTKGRRPPQLGSQILFDYSRNYGIVHIY